ncbi:efflux RND transporter permease subunit, partial [Vibrio parahaemolyticus]|nr:efflux RND transporter permease subunit [Vibrio parahaemolyticus]
ALGVMALILITQFNSFYQAFLILSAVLFSTVGVFAGLLIFQIVVHDILASDVHIVCFWYTRNAF